MSALGDFQAIRDFAARMDRRVGQATEPPTRCIYCDEFIEERTHCDAGEDHHPACFDECPTCSPPLFDYSAGGER